MNRRNLILGAAAVATIPTVATASSLEKFVRENSDVKHLIIPDRVRLKVIIDPWREDHPSYPILLQQGGPYLVEVLMAFNWGRAYLDSNFPIDAASMYITKHYPQYVTGWNAHESVGMKVLHIWEKAYDRS